MTASQLLGAAAPAPTFEHFVDGDTAATFLGITRRTLLQKVRDGKIPGTRSIHRQKRRTGGFSYRNSTPTW